MWVLYCVPAVLDFACYRHCACSREICDMELCSLLILCSCISAKTVAMYTPNVMSSRHLDLNMMSVLY